MLVHPARVRSLSNAAPRTGPVVYWQSRDQRADDNWALLWAAEQARESGAPLLVVFCLSTTYPGATWRQYAFMEPPSRFLADLVRDEKSKVFRALRPLTEADPAADLVLGQYGSGLVDGRPAAAYRDEPGVAPDSTTPTFAALRLYVDNWRWQGVPFLLVSGKRLPAKRTEIAVQFKPVPVSMPALPRDPPTHQTGGWGYPPDFRTAGLTVRHAPFAGHALFAHDPVGLALGPQQEGEHRLAGRGLVATRGRIGNRHRHPQVLRTGHRRHRGRTRRIGSLRPAFKIRHLVLTDDVPAAFAFLIIIHSVRIVID